jgi:hypothetical protein
MSLLTKGIFLNSIVEYKNDLVMRLLVPNEKMVAMMTFPDKSKFYNYSRIIKANDNNLVVVATLAAAPAIVKCVRCFKVMTP